MDLHSIRRNQGETTIGTTKLFLGYDPGGKDKNGVAAVRTAADGAVESEPATETLHDAQAVCRWVHERRSDAVALGIDTLLAWSCKGSRKCDDALRERYHEHGQSVITQNSLYSSMTINGVVVAQCGRDLDLPLFESHPKTRLPCMARVTHSGHRLRLLVRQATQQGRAA